MPTSLTMEPQGFAVQTLSFSSIAPWVIGLTLGLVAVWLVAVWLFAAPHYGSPPPPTIVIVASVVALCAALCTGTMVLASESAQIERDQTAAFAEWAKETHDVSFTIAEAHQLLYNSTPVTVDGRRYTATRIEDGTIHLFADTSH